MKRVVVAAALGAIAGGVVTGALVWWRLSSRIEFNDARLWSALNIDSKASLDRDVILSDQIGALRDGDKRWWCRTDLPCFRDKKICETVDEQHPVGCVQTRISFCGGERGGDCYQSLGACAANNMERLRAGHYDSTLCVGVE